MQNETNNTNVHLELCTRMTDIIVFRTSNDHDLKRFILVFKTIINWTRITDMVELMEQVFESTIRPRKN